MLIFFVKGLHIRVISAYMPSVWCLVNRLESTPDITTGLQLGQAELHRD